MQQKIRILCVDDHEIVREGISLIVALQPDMQVVDLAATAKQAVEMFRRHRPDVTLMDIRLTLGNGVTAIRSIIEEFPSARIIALSMYQSAEAIHEALKAGAVTFLSKNTPADQLLQTIRDVDAGRRPLSDAIKAKMSERDSETSLTHREIEVIDLVSHGLRNKEIAGSLGIREETVEVHLRNIFSKMSVNDRTAAVRVAVQRGIIDLT
jgi:DNA-binding NarL/FixJ family response regulator